MSVSRAGFVTRRRKNAQPIETRTITATTFCIALTAAQRRPSNGIDSTAWMTPPVTMLAVPIVRSTKPQKMPACMSPARGSLNIFVWTKAYWIRPANRAGMSANGLGPLGAGRGEHPQVAGHREREERGRAPEQREDQRVGRDLGERSTRSPTASSAARLPPWSNGPASVSSAWSSTGSIAANDSMRALRAARHVDDERPAAHADDAARQVGERRDRPAGGPHRLGQPGHLVVDDGSGRLRRHVARRQARATGRDDQSWRGGAVAERSPMAGDVVRHERRSTA